MLRLSWSQPEDLVPHAFAAARLDDVEIDDLAARWRAAGGSDAAPVSGATPTPASDELRALGRRLLDEVDARPVSATLAVDEPDELDAILAAARSGAGAGSRAAAGTDSRAEGDRSSTDATASPDAAPVLSRQGVLSPDRTRQLDRDRVLGAWLGRAAGCLLGKPVEKIPRDGVRAIAESTGNWPIRGYFTEVGLDPAVAARYPWNRRSRPTSLVENIDGMPEDDDLNYPLTALRLLERYGADVTTDEVAQAWLDDLPAGRVFTAERIAYRNLLDGVEPDAAAGIRNPFTDWIGALIRTDVYGWTHPGDPVAAARLAYADAVLSHRRNGVYGAMFAAGMCAAAPLADTVDEVIEAGLSVVPSRSRLAEAVRFGSELGRGELDDADALDALHARYGRLHWVHVLNNTAALVFALVRSGGDFVTATGLAVSAGWDTDSIGATAGSVIGALTGASALPTAFVAPLRDRLASSIPGFDGVSFTELADRTLAVIASARGGDASASAPAVSSGQDSLPDAMSVEGASVGSATGGGAR